MAICVRLEPRQIESSAELAELTCCARGDGAIVSFVGVARNADKAGLTVERVILEHHPRLTEKSLQAIASDAASRFDVSHIRVVHRYGEVRPGEPIVFAAASAKHRRAAFEAADYVVDRLKTEAVFWKREEGPNGSAWIEPTDRDYADSSRWE